MKKILSSLTVVVISSLCSCSSNNDFNKGKQQLKNQGYTNISNTGYSFFCCSEEDTFSTGFKATDKNGNKVTGCFCSGLLKGITIRFD